MCFMIINILFQNNVVFDFDDFFCGKIKKYYQSTTKYTASCYLPQWLQWVVQQSFYVQKRSLEQLIAPRRIDLERSRHWFKLQEWTATEIDHKINVQIWLRPALYSPSRPKVRVRVAERRAKLPEIAVHRTGEALERHAEVPLQTLEDADGQRGLRDLRLLGDVRQIAEKRLVAAQHAPDARNKEIELFVVVAIVAIELFLFFFLLWLNRIKRRGLDFEANFGVFWL